MTSMQAAIPCHNFLPYNATLNNIVHCIFPSCYYVEDDVSKNTK